MTEYTYWTWVLKAIGNSINIIKILLQDNPHVNERATMEIRRYRDELNDMLRELEQRKQ